MPSRDWMANASESLGGIAEHYAPMQIANRIFADEGGSDLCSLVRYFVSSFLNPAMPYLADS